MDETPTESTSGAGDPVRSLLVRALSMIERGDSEGVERLLRDHPDHAGELRGSLDELRRLRLVGADGAASSPPHIGPYRILGTLGEGGMGTVYRAEQQDTVRRLVAVKVIKPGMDTAGVLVRFELERRALAAMNHSNIARVYDAGSTAGGQPYFAMELIEGAPITDYCDSHRLGVRDRVALFRQVCAGVQHAHQKGVIHRDLKPGNILVTREADRAVAKILDFGLAKATNRDLVERSLYTEHADMLGTPEYMAPEQVAIDDTSIDTRADIYSLGVILYQLLAGQLPFPSAELRRGGWLEIQRKLEDEEPPKLGSKLATGDAATARVAWLRGTTRQSLVRGLRGDLDWIVAKAMAKEPERRYASAAELAAELQRYLRYEPVIAGPPSTAYRVKKFVRRYRGQVVAAALLAASLGTGLVAFAGEKRRADRALDRLRLTRYSFELDELRGRANELFPAWPGGVSGLKAWVDDGQRLRAAVDRIRSARDALRSLAHPASATDRQKVAAYRKREVEPLRRQLASMRHAAAVRNGLAEHRSPSLAPEVKTEPASRLLEQAKALVDYGRKRWGEESRGLAMAELALQKIESGDRSATQVGVLVAIARGQYAVGLDHAAIATLDKATELDTARHDFLANERDRLSDQIAKAHDPDWIPRVERQLAGANLRAQNERDWRFDDEANTVLHGMLSRLLLGLSGFLDPRHGTLSDVARRLAWARQVAPLTLRHPRAQVTWDDARQAIAASPRYGEALHDLAPQTGLVPIGENPVTGLWEFYHLRSAWDPLGHQDPRDLPIPTLADYDEYGGLRGREDLGIVFVLIPGGTYRVGCQSHDPSQALYDPMAEGDEGPPHSVGLAPFFIAKHEITQAQWRRLTGSNPSKYPKFFHLTGMGPAVTGAHPVESVSYKRARLALERLRLRLPTNAQWEAACRAGSDEAWCSGTDAEKLADFANLKDAHNWQYNRQGGRVDWDDGFALHAPVGSFRPNGFGLHDMHGNVYEWVADVGPYSRTARAGDGFRDTPGPFAILRGGCFESIAQEARSAKRTKSPVDGTHDVIGVRPARAVLP